MPKNQPLSLQIKRIPYTVNIKWNILYIALFKLVVFLGDVLDYILMCQRTFMPFSVLLECL